MCTGPLSYAIIKIKVAAKGKGREKAKRVDCCCSALEAPAGIVCLLLCCVTHSGASKHWASLSSFLVFFKGLRRGFCFFFFLFFFRFLPFPSAFHVAFLLLGNERLPSGGGKSSQTAAAHLSPGARVLFIRLLSCVAIFAFRVIGWNCSYFLVHRSFAN